MAHLRLLLVLTLAATALSAGPAHALTVGIADQQASSFSDTRLLALNLRYARYVVPWNAATAQPQKVRTWLNAVESRGLVPHIAFEHSASDRCPNRPCTAPTLAQYRSSIANFLATFPEVKTYTTWNEGNHTLQPTRTNPALAAGYYQELRAQCPDCTIVAGDVLDSGNMTGWIRAFLAALPSPPQLWGLHNWGDQQTGGTGGMDELLALVPGTLWIEETGAMVRLRNSFGRQTASLGEDETAAPIADVFTAARARLRIDRMYIYQWVGGAAGFDSGLTDGAGRLRASYYELQRQLGLAATTTTTPKPIRWKVSWSKARRRQLVVQGTCPVAGTRCLGSATVTLRVRTTRGKTLVTKRLRSGTYATNGAARRVTWRLTVSKKVRSIARRKGVQRAAILRVVARQPTARTSRTTLKVAKPA